MLLKENRAFRHLFAGRILCILADSIMFFSMLKWIEQHSSTSSSFTWFYVAFYLPITFLALPIGAWISNKTLQKVMTYSTTIQITMLTAFILLHPFLAYQWVYGLLIIISILQLFFIPANQSLLPHIVDNEDRPRANSLLQLGYTAAKVLGQIGTALLIKLSFAPMTLMIASIVLLAMSVYFIRRIKPFIKNESSNKQSQLSSVKEGVRYILTMRELKLLFIFLGLAMLFATSIDLILVSFLKEQLAVGVENLSFIGTASLSGFAIGAMIVPKLYKHIDRKWLMIPPLFALSLGTGSLFVIENWVWILPFFFLQGIALGCFNVTFITYLQDVVSSENYTRTFSLYHMLSSSMALPGILLTGFMLEEIGVLSTILIVAAMLFLIGVIGVSMTPKLGKGHREEVKQTKTELSISG
ncbi:MFS transporter [Paenibacillus sp. N1-5-1-14]|uniref:MFS transporter n=1 Tax=Paenibacillus radicibacter TaxID=2972488 RepID=UPI00215907E2|nr:MFS transporter [Paenibacillus radicibacter]MCR8644248.1 MFS transporter [Paenibacillus radicibacter]